MCLDILRAVALSLKPFAKCCPKHSKRWHIAVPAATPCF